MSSGEQQRNSDSPMDSRTNGSPKDAGPRLTPPAGVLNVANPPSNFEKVLENGSWPPPFEYFRSLDKEPACSCNADRFGGRHSLWCFGMQWHFARSQAE